MLLPFSVDAFDDGSRVLIRVGGEVDHRKGPQLRECVVTAAGSGLPVEVDLSDVRFMDSSGVGSLVQASRDAQMLGTTLRVVGMSDPVEKLLHLTGTADLLGVETGTAGGATLADGP
jgi:anti-sigma B factor antagonist